ncbi:hypothetical protein MHTCC0001_18770 [Flavobacteriaceae bacterium MHTCC 0001]
MLKKVLFILPFFLLGFKPLFTDKSAEEYIIGTWVSDDDANWKRIFYENGKCHDLYTGEETDIYNYSIIKESLLALVQCH